MGLFAFDGTGNEDKPGDGEDSNVLKFHRAYDEPNKHYIPGVGTRYGGLGAIFGGAFGMGAHTRLEEAMARLKRNLEAGDDIIDIVGFSRGAATALEFANEIRDEFAGGSRPPEIRFLGLWDTVASFGIPGNNINLGFELTLPTNLGTCRHAISLDERRRTFPLTRVTQDKYSNKDLCDVQEVWFRGYHSDVGGGNENEGLSNIPLYWMCLRAQEAGLNLKSDHVEQAKTDRAPRTDPKTPGMDRIADNKRTIRKTDIVHDSVTRIERAGRFAANNPPRGLAVIGDDGVIRPNGFEE